MLPQKITLLVLLFSFLSLTAQPAAMGDSHDGNAAVPAPPKTNVEAVKETINGVSVPTLEFNSGVYGTPTNVNSNFAYSTRQVQLGARVSF